MLPSPTRLSTGLSDFAAIRRGGAIYVDKTDMVFELTRLPQSFFLSRPRRFGKSLLVSTFENYFLGRKELFEGLRIYDLENATEEPWVEYPIFKFSFSGGELVGGVRELELRIADTLDDIESRYGLDPGEARASLAVRLGKDLRLAKSQMGRSVVVLVDEYDRPLEAVRGGEMEAVRDLLKGFWGILKDKQECLRFAFFTGVTKYQKVSIFSELNNLVEITSNPDYAALCGLTRREVEGCYPAHVARLAAEQGMTVDECHAELARLYDGYHFAWPSEGVYNPYSVLYAFADRRFGERWFTSGTPTLLPRRIREEGFDVAALLRGGIRETESALADLNPGNMALVPLLFQTGYLTLAGPMGRDGRYPLDFPNHEVRHGFTSQLLPLFAPAMARDGELSIYSIREDLLSGDVDACLRRMRAVYASQPYERGAPLADPVESTFQNVIYIVFNLLGVDARAEVSGARGVADIVVETPGHVYVMEFKRDSSPEEAMRQIEARGYASRFAATTRRVHLVGVNFSSAMRQIDGWVEK